VVDDSLVSVFWTSCFRDHASLAETSADAEELTPKALKLYPTSKERTNDPDSSEETVLPSEVDASCVNDSSNVGAEATFIQYPRTGGWE